MSLGNTKKGLCFLGIFRNVLEQQFIKSLHGDASVTMSSVMTYRYYPANCILEVEGDLERDILIIIFIYKNYWQKFFLLIHANPLYTNFPSISAENVRKPKVFWLFQGVQKWDIGIKRVNPVSWQKVCKSVIIFI